VIRHRATRRPLGFVAAVTAIVVVAACSSSKGSTTATTTAGGATTAAAAGGTTTTTADPMAAAQASVAAAEKGTYTDVDPTPRAAVKGKHIVIISSGQANISNLEPTNGAMEAAKALGWQVEVYDAKLNPANNSPLVRQAIAAHADGIILDAIDCDQAQQALQEAKAANIALVPIYAFDCNDAQAGNEPTGLFSAGINYAPIGADVDAFTEAYGAAQANYIINASHNAAKIIAIQTPGFTVLTYTLKGFADTIKASGGSKIVDTMQVSQADLLSGHLPAMIQAELLRFPDANWVKSPYTYVTTLGIGPALQGKAGSINVMGGEGFQPELDLIRSGIVTAVNVISSEWTGWAAVDTMNSVFRHEKPAQSGIGWQIADKAHIPASGALDPTVDFKSEYQKAWGVS
jgi:ribose transport system substrate-binding protein